MLAAPLRRISGVHFGVLVDDVAKTISKLEIQNENIEKDTEGGGLFDLSLGTLTRYRRCHTCGHTREDIDKNNQITPCAGHSGTLQLRFGYMIPHFVDYIKKMLKHICYTCRRFHNPIPKDRRCSNCGPESLILILDMYNHGFLIRLRNNDKRILFADEVKQYLQNIPPSAAYSVFGVAIPPQNLVSNQLFINSIVIRPDKKVQSAQTPKDELVVNLQHMVQASIAMRQLDKNDPNFEEINKKFCKNIFMYQKSKQTDDSGLKKSIASSLTSKEGRIRNNMLGKKAGHMARTVIICKSTISPNTIVIPLQFAMNQTVRETVRPYNIQRLTLLFNNGPGVYPGANFICKQGDLSKKFVIGHQNTKLEIGDVVFRHILDGDVALFTRQPILVAESICGMDVQVSRDPQMNAIAMNVLACGLFNADFDGDEMNLLIVTNLSSLSEVQYISAIHNRTISMSNNKLAITQVQDSIIGGFNMTYQESDVVFDDVFVRRIHQNSKVIFDSQQFSPSGKPQTANQVLSMVLPCLSYNEPTFFYDPDLEDSFAFQDRDKTLKIHLGEIVGGYFDDKASGFQKTLALNSPQKTSLDIIYSIQQAIIKFNEYSGQTLGLKDFQRPPNKRQKLTDLKDKVMAKCRQLSHDYLQNQVLGEKDFLNQMAKELQVLQNKNILMEYNNDSKNKVTNNLIRMIMSKSKGSWDNIFQLTVMIGLIYVDNDFIQKSFNNRTSCFFKQCDVDPISHGIIIDSYSQGLNPSQLLFNSIPERVRMLDKVLTVADAGALGRYMRRNMETILCMNNHTLGCPESITQLLFGNDGFLIDKCTSVKVPFLDLSVENLVQTLNKLIPSTIKDTKILSLIQTAFNQKVVAKHIQRFKEQMVAKALNFDNYDVSGKILVPIDIRTIVATSITSKFDGNFTIKAEELLLNCEQLTQFVKSLKYIYFNDDFLAKERKIPEYFDQGLLGLKTIILSYLTVDKLAQISPLQLNVLLNSLYTSIQYKLMPYGYVAGVNTAQCYQQYFTQDMLDSIHKIGGTSVRKTEITRVKELFGHKEPEDEAISPIIRIPAAATTSMDTVVDIANHIRILQLSTLVDSWYVIFTDLVNRQINQGRSQYNNLFEDELTQEEYQLQPNQYSSWCLRLVMNRDAMVQQQIDVQYLVESITEKTGVFIKVDSMREDSQLVIRAHIPLKGQRFSDPDFMKNYVDSFLETTVRGLKSFDKVSIEKKLITELVDGQLKQSERLFINAEGTEINKIYMLQTKWPTELEYALVKSDNVRLIETEFGKLAAQQTLIDQLIGITGEKVGYKHVQLVASEMCRLPHITQVSGNGVSLRNPNEDLLSIATHKPIQRLVKSAAEKRRSNVRSVSSCLMTGQVPEAGTHFNKIVLHPNMI